MKNFRIEYKYLENNGAFYNAWQHDWQITAAESMLEAEQNFKKEWINPAVLVIKEVDQVGPVEADLIARVWIAGHDNPCLCVDINSNSKKLLENLSGRKFEWDTFSSGDGDEGMLSMQYPNSPDSLRYVTGICEDEIGHDNLDEFWAEITSILGVAEQEVSERDFSLDRCFGTSNIKVHQTPVQHGYYQNIGSIVIFENLDENDTFYLGFESHQHSRFEREMFLEFSSYDDACDFVKSDEIWGNALDGSDFSISERLYLYLKKQ